MKLFTTLLLSTGLLSTTLLTVGCSSSSDDPLRAPGNSGETSEPAPGGDDQEPLSNLPGGDTSAIAGYWDGTIGGQGEQYFVIAPDGLWTEYFLSYDGDIAENCYWVAETQTLTPEDPAANAYSLADGRALTLTTDEQSTVLTVEYLLEERDVQLWPAVSGQMPEDLPLCTE